jgi:SWI/SNF-related matrix-associated actin-dependent regulator 1 of chromatin subfamily A
MPEALFDYQIHGADYLASHPHALLADDMGVGKTAQAIRACDLVAARNILVCCPATLRPNWLREFEKFSPFDRRETIITTGDGEPADGLNVVSYDLIAASEKLRKKLHRPWDVLILDEAHYLKERTANRTRAIYGHRKTPGIMAHARFVWRLTGTPAPNFAHELYTHLLSAGIINMPYWDFVFKFCTGFDSGYGFRITGHQNTTELKQLLSRFMLRRKKADVLKDLPPIVFHTQVVERSEVELDPWFLEEISGVGVPAFLARLETTDKMVKSAMDTIDIYHRKDRLGDKVHVLEALAESSATLRRYIGMAKAKSIASIIDDDLKNKAYDKVVIFAVHHAVIESLRQMLAHHGAVTLYGGTPGYKRQKRIDKFQKNPKCKVFIGNIQAAGVGITLTAAHEVVFAECSWRPDENAQAAMRCHRIGQTEKVRVRIFSCAGSVDERVQMMLTTKLRELSKIID